MRLASVSLLAGLLVLGGCTADEATPTARTTPASPSPTTAGATPGVATSSHAPAGPTIIAADSDYGPVLFDDTGQAVYLFDVETTARPRCYGECAALWPPVIAQGLPVAGEGVRQRLLGLVKRTNGEHQVTYDGHPLYFYVHEGKHEVRCHDVFLNGGTWYAVSPDGGAAPTN
jgi:predicted lipoprotein with Yx(FWY)xxD motif